VITRCELDIWEATTFTLAVFWAAVIDAADLASLVVFLVILAMEIFIADFRSYWWALPIARNLIVNVKVLCATMFHLALDWIFVVIVPTAVDGVDLLAIGITFVVGIAEVVLVMLVAELMLVKFDQAIVGAFRFRPLACVVNVDTDGGAVLVCLLPSHIDASF